MRTEIREDQVWPYTERDAVLADVAMQTLLAPVETGEEDRITQLVAFAGELFVSPDSIVDTYKDLEAVDLTSTVAGGKTLYAGYFETEEGRKDLQSLGVSGATNPGSLYTALCVRIANGEDIDKKAKIRTASTSRNWYVSQIAQSLETPDRTDEWEDSPVVYINYAPENLLKKFEALQAYRGKFRKISHQLGEEPESELRDDKTKLLALYWAKVNNMTALLYPSMVHFAEQLKMSPDTERTREWSIRLQKAAPIAKYLFKEGKLENEYMQQDFMRRLDLLRNGAEQDESGPDFSPIANKDLVLAQSLEAEIADALDESVERVPDDIVVELDQKTWDKDDLQRLLAGVLDRWGFLSDTALVDEAVLEERTGPAADGKWQFVFVSSGDSLSVDGKKRVMKIPKSFQRSGSKSLAIAAHELEHVVENEYDERMADKVPLAKIGGRRRTTGREMGGIYEERRLYAMLGRLRPTNTTYLRALEAKLDGQDQLHVADVFYQTAREPDARTAADRVLRLYRNGGHNSQPVDYLEQELLLREMTGLPAERVRVLTSSITTFSFKDAAVLHKMGLLEIPDHIDQHPAEDVVSVYMSQRQAA